MATALLRALFPAAIASRFSFTTEGSGAGEETGAQRQKALLLQLLRAVLLQLADFVSLSALHSCEKLRNDGVRLKYFEDIEQLEDGAFEGCTSLASITLPLPDGLSIGDGAFFDCPLDDEAKAAVRAINVWAVRPPIDAQGHATVPEGLTTIASSAFSGCSSLASITLPAGLTSIGDGAFNRCSALVSVTLPASLTSIGSYAFCSSSFSRVAFPAGLTSLRSQLLLPPTFAASAPLPAPPGPPRTRSFGLRRAPPPLRRGAASCVPRAACGGCTFSWRVVADRPRVALTQGPRGARAGGGRAGESRMRTDPGETSRVRVQVKPL